MCLPWRLHQEQHRFQAATMVMGVPSLRAQAETKKKRKTRRNLAKKGKFMNGPALGLALFSEDEEDNGPALGSTKSRELFLSDDDDYEDWKDPTWVPSEENESSDAEQTVNEQSYQNGSSDAELPTVDEHPKYPNGNNDDNRNLFKDRNLFSLFDM